MRPCGRAAGTLNMAVLLKLSSACRTATARGKAELADIAAEHAREDHEIARLTAKQFAPDFQQPCERSSAQQSVTHIPTQ